MKPLTIEVHDNHADLLAGWKVLSAVACDSHGLALVVLIKPTEHEKVQAETLTQVERHTMLDCVIQRFQYVVQRVFGRPIVVATVQTITPPAFIPPPQPPGTKPQEN